MLGQIKTEIQGIRNRVAQPAHFYTRAGLALVLRARAQLAQFSARARPSPSQPAFKVKPW